ncbi:F-box protein At5g07610-like [Rutidosis leptorrhynchoides]|uniref:F-box protein At5g07610-like n=1 Tax=Rutidosis leptorrhynchoides TaxID=125765 RepID=UPI003A99CA48
MGLAVHPADCRYYKLVYVYQNRDCSSKTKRWKELNETLYTPNHVPYLSCGVYVNGGIYWSPFNNHIDSWYYFKLGIKKFQKLELPSSMKMQGSGMVMSVCYFGESGGRLHLSDLVRLNGQMKLIVYEMMSYNSRWVVMYQVEIDQFIAQLHNGMWLEVLDIVRGEEEKDTFMVVKYLNEIKRFNLFDKSFKKLSIVPVLYKIVSGLELSSSIGSKI